MKATLKDSFETFLIAISMSLMAVPPAWSQTYQIVDLGTLGGTYSNPLSINNASQIVGISDTSSGERHAFVYQDGTMRDINPDGSVYSTLNKINDHGQAVGRFENADQSLIHAFMYDATNRVFSDLHSRISLGGSLSSAVGINSIGQVAGWSTTAGGSFHAVVLDLATGGLTDLGTLGGPNSVAFDMNDAGQVVGGSDTADGKWHAFLFSMSTGQRFDLGTLGGNDSVAYRINSVGQIVGWADTGSGESHAFGVAANVVIDVSNSDLGTLGGPNSNAFGVSGSGQIVGGSETFVPDSHAFLRSSDGNAVDLNTLVDLGTMWSNLVAASDMSDNGQIVGQGIIQIANGDGFDVLRHGYLLLGGTSRDLTPPVITPIVTGTTGSNGWYVSSVAVTWSVTDPESPISSSSGCEPTTLTADTNGTTLNCSAISGGGAADAAPLVVKLDRTLPTIAITTPPNGLTYALSQKVAAGYNCTDAGSGVAACVGPVTNGANIDTGSVGTKSFMVNASDLAGNVTTLIATYNVRYDFSGFYQPVDNLPTLNAVKAGAAIPVKFSLSGSQGLNVLATGSPTSGAIPCASQIVDDIEQTVTAGNSALSYDATTATYTYVWKTSAGWANTCRQLTMKLADGTEHVALFKFK
jgi:probable HAF family extracellular repeat protein